MHDRCALAVLTSNLILSIWTVAADPAEPSSWERGCIISHVLRDYFRSARDVPAKPSHSLRKATRVRAFTWGPAMSTNNIPASEPIRRRVTFLAILNDQAELVLMSLAYSSYSTAEGMIKTGVVCSFKLDLERPEDPTGAPPSLEWHPWISHENDMETSITSTWGDRKQSIRIQWNPSDPGNLQTKLFCAENREAGVSHRSTSSWPIPQAQLIGTTNAYMAERLEYLKDKFSDENDLQGRVRLAYWGHAAYENLLAILVTVHPSTMIQYLVPAAELSYILFSHTALSDSSEHAGSFEFEWKNDKVPKSHTEACANSWDFIIEQFPLEKQSAGPSNNLVDIAGETQLLRENSELLCRQLIYSYTCSALYHGWEIQQKALDIFEWASGIEKGSVSMINDIIEESRNASTGDEKLNCVKMLNDVLSATGVPVEQCEICDSNILWNGLESAQCVEGHCFGRQIGSRSVRSHC